MDYRNKLKDKKRIVVKVGSSTLIHKNTGNLNYGRIEKLVRVLSDIKNSGKDVILVSSGAVAAGREILNIGKKEKTMAEKQACAAIGQCKLMRYYQKIFSEYNQIASQILMTKYCIKSNESYCNLKNTFIELLKYGSIPIINENDTIATDEIKFGDNDTLSAIVAGITESDLLIMLTDTDGLFTENPSQNKNAKLIEKVEKETEELYKIAQKTSDTDVGTGGMYTKVFAAGIANKLGTDVIIANGENPEIIKEILFGKNVGTFFISNKKIKENLRDFLIKETQKSEI